MISADVKAKKKQQEIKDPVAVYLTNFHKEVHSKLEIQCKKQGHVFFI